MAKDKSKSEDQSGEFRTVELTSKIYGPKGETIPKGTVTKVEFGEDGQPVEKILRGRVRVLNVATPLAGNSGEGQAQAAEIIADAEAEAKKIVDAAKAEAVKIVDAAKAEAAKTPPPPPART